MKAFWEKIAKNPTYKKIFKNPFTYVTGAVLLSVFQIALFAVSGNPWGVYYFSSTGAQSTLNAGFLNHTGSWLDVGIIVGALLAALLASQWKFKKIKSLRQVVAAILGGLLMGYGARLAGGCNIGALYSSIASLSVSGWVFAIFLFVGAFIGSKLLAKYFM